MSNRQTWQITMIGPGFGFDLSKTVQIKLRFRYSWISVTRTQNEICLLDALASLGTILESGSLSH